MLVFGILLYVYVIYLVLINIGKMSNREKTICLIFNWIFLFSLIVFRPLDVPDTESYKSIFERIDTKTVYGFILGSKEYTTGVEYGFLLFSKFIKKYISNNFRVYFSVIALVQIFLYIRISNKICGNDAKKKCYLLFFSMPYIGLVYTCVVLRGGIALLLGINALLEKRKNIVLKIFLYLLAFSFHRSSILIIGIELIYLFFPIMKKRVYWVLWLFSGILMFISSSSIYKMVFDLLNVIFTKLSFFKYQHYFENSNLTRTGIPLRNVFFWSIGLVFLLFFKIVKSKRFLHMFNVYIIGLFIMNALSFIAGASRIYDYFLISIPILFMDIYSVRIVTTTNKKKIWNAGIKRKMLWLFELLYGIAGVTIILRL